MMEGCDLLTLSYAEKNMFLRYLGSLCFGMCNKNLSSISHDYTHPIQLGSGDHRSSRVGKLSRN